MLAVSADANTSAGAPCSICNSSAPDEPKLNVTVVPLYFFSKAVPIVVKPSVSEAAADTVIEPVGLAAVGAAAPTALADAPTSATPSATAANHTPTERPPTERPPTNGQLNGPQLNGPRLNGDPFLGTA